MNRIIPEDVTDPYFGKWKDIQAEHLQTVRESFEPVPILTARLFDREMVGVQLLEEMGQEVYGDLPVTDVLYRDDPIRVRRRSGGTSSRCGSRSSRANMDIHRRGEELYVRVGPQTQPDPAADPAADGGPRRQLRRGPSRDRLRAAAGSRRPGKERTWLRPNTTRRAAEPPKTTDGARPPRQATAAGVHGRVLPDLLGGDGGTGCGTRRGRAPARRGARSSSSRPGRSSMFGAIT